MSIHSTFQSFSKIVFCHRFVILTFAWIFGLSSGVAIAFRTNLFTVSWMPALLCSRLSILGLFGVCFIPFLLSMIAFRFRAIVFVYIIAIAKSFLYGFCHYSVYRCFGNAGWLMRALLLFSDTYISIMLLWYWEKNIDRCGQWLFKSTALFAGVCFAICLLDVLFISPIIINMAG